MQNISRRIQDGLWVVQRTDTDVQVWLAIGRDGLTYMSYSEDNARLWLSRERDER
jgi:hypothetical protein